MEQTRGKNAHSPAPKPNILQHQCIHLENHGHETYIEYCANCSLNWNFYFMQWYEFVLLARTRAIFLQSYVDRTKRIFWADVKIEKERFVSWFEEERKPFD